MKISKEKYMPWLLVLPAMIIIFGFTLYPLFHAIYYSTRNTDLKVAEDMFIGIDNYRRLLNYDSELAEAVVRTLTYLAGCLIIQIPLGFAVALLLNRDFKGRRVARTIITLPLAAAPIAIGQVWRYMYHYEFGIIKYLCSLIFGSSPNWTADPNWAMLAIIIYDSWQWTPFVALVLLAGLQSLPPEPYESATIYGATTLQKFRYITLPKMRGLIGFVALFRLIDLVKTWDPIMAITWGGPGRATELLSWYLYRVGFYYFWVGYASAISLLFLYSVIVLSTVFIKKIAKY
jgi:multiple sugar transport system permease protein